MVLLIQLNFAASRFSQNCQLISRRALTCTFHPDMLYVNLKIENQVAMNIFWGELIGTLLLVLLGDGSVANVLLKPTLSDYIKI